MVVTRGANYTSVRPRLDLDTELALGQHCSLQFQQFLQKIAPLDANVNPTDYGLNTGITDPRLFGFPTINPGSDWFDYMGEGVRSWPAWTSPSRTFNYSDSVSIRKGDTRFASVGTTAMGVWDYLRAPSGRGRVYFDDLPSFFTGSVGSWELRDGDPNGTST